MADDIVTRLRALAHPTQGLARGFYDAQDDLNEAAAEIERLRHEATAFVLRPEDRLVIVAPEGTDPQVCEHIKHSTGISDRVIVIAKPMEARRG